MAYIPKKRNTPIATLIRNYINKKSGKVIESRNEIRTRFEYLDWKDQKKILLANLDSCKADRTWAYMKIYSHWDPCFEPKVKDMWEKYHEPVCAWSVIRFFPISYIKENMESFTGERDYFFICTRLADDPNFVLDRNKLKTIDYLTILYNTGRTISEEEANDILYEIVYEVCFWGQLKFAELDNSWINEDLFLPSQLKDVSNGLFYLNRMRIMEPIGRFYEWSGKVGQLISQGPEYQRMHELHVLDNRFVKIEILLKYAYQALDEKYKQVLPPFIEKALNTVDLKPFRKTKRKSHSPESFFLFPTRSIWKNWSKTNQHWKNWLKAMTWKWWIILMTIH